MKPFDEKEFIELMNRSKSPTAEILEALNAIERNRKRDGVVPLVLTVIGTVAAVVAAVFSGIQLFHG